MRPSVELTGRIVSAPELDAYGRDGKRLARLVVETTHQRRDWSTKQITVDTDQHVCITYLASLVQQLQRHALPGRLVIVRGELVYRPNGTRQSRVAEILLDRDHQIEFLDTITLDGRAEPARQFVGEDPPTAPGVAPIPAVAAISQPGSTHSNDDDWLDG